MVLEKTCSILLCAQGNAEQLLSSSAVARASLPHSTCTIKHRYTIHLNDPMEYTAVVVARVCLQR